MGESTRWPVSVVTGLLARRSARSAVLWGYVFGIYVVSSALGYASVYKTIADRRRLAHSFGTNIGIQALIGPARHIDTVAGFTAWRTVGVLSLVGAVWGLLAGTRLLRGEEDAGRWEILLAGPTTRRRATGSALTALFAGLGTLWAVTAVAAIGAGRAHSVRFSPTASLFLATALAASAAVFLALGAFTSQLGTTRRQAASVGAAVLGVAYALRMVADSGTHLSWLLSVTPLGWVEELRPLTGSRSLALVPIGALATALGGAAVVLAGRRDVGAGTLPHHDSRAPRVGLLTGPLGLTVRTGRPVALGWLAGIAALGVMIGLVSQSAAATMSGSGAVEKAVQRLGGTGTGAVTYLGLTFLIQAALIALVAAGQAAAARDEEAGGRLEQLLVRPVSRWSWLRSRVTVATATILACGLVAGISAWAGATSQHTDVGFTNLLEAGLNLVAPALFVLGAATFVHGAAPRLTAAAAYGLVGWSFLVELLGGVLRVNHWLLDASVLYHMAPAPAVDPNWASAGALAGLGAAVALGGGWLFNRRDLVSS